MNHLSPLSQRVSLSRVALILSVALLFIGCGSETPAASTARTSSPNGGMPIAQAPGAATSSQEVLAVVDGREVTLADLQDAIGDQLGQMDFQYLSQRHQVIDEAMRRHVRELLLEAEATDRGVSVEALLEEVLADKVDVSDDDVQFFYIQNQTQLQGRAFESMAPQIRNYLESQIRDSVLEEFTEGVAEAREVDYLYEPFRVAIDTAGAPSIGPADAPVTLIEFSDFECPYCQSFTATLEQIKEAYEGDVRVVFLQFPLRDIHPNAQKAAEASLCAFDQGKFWEAHDIYFAQRDNLDVPGLKGLAEQLDLDVDRFSACLDSGTYADRVDAEMSAGVSVGVSGTPAVFVNGRPLPGGAVPFEMVAELIDDELARLGR